MSMGKNEAALAEFNAVFAKDPSAPVLAKLAELQINKGNSAKPSALIEGSEFKEDSTVQFALAKARIATRETEKARDVLDRLIRTNKYNAAYYHYRGLELLLRSELLQGQEGLRPGPEVQSRTTWMRSTTSASAC